MPDWLIAHLITVGKLAANGVLSAEKTEPIREIAKRAPLTTRQRARTRLHLSSFW